jgi:hypothetical protein
MLSYSFADVRNKTEGEFSIDVRNNLSRLVTRNPEQQRAWDVTARWVHAASNQLGSKHDRTRVIFEHRPPLHDTRSDLLVVTKDHILVIEAKTGVGESVRGTRRQLNDYAKILFDLIHFDKERAIIQIALRENAPEKFELPAKDPSLVEPTEDDIIDLRPNYLGQVLREFEAPDSYEATDPSEWLYSPRPDVVRSGTALLSEMSDKSVLAALTDDEELDRVVRTCREIIRDVQSGRAPSRHAIIAITGVPGAGKTLVGLRLAGDEEITRLTQSEDGKTSRPLYLTGNPTLVEVIRESIARDRVNRDQSGQTKLKQARRDADSVLRSVHKVTEEGLKGLFHILVFDEAQRAWTAKKMSEEVKKDNRDESRSTVNWAFDSDDPEAEDSGKAATSELPSTEIGSEPEELMKLLEKEGLKWSVVICLIGTGQEINKGEEGLATWAVAVDHRRGAGVDWKIYANEDSAKREGIETYFEKRDQLHLRTVRRAENASQLGDWVDLLISGDWVAASELRRQFDRFPIVATRDLNTARDWVRGQVIARSQTYGLLASSGSGRLEPYGLTTVGAGEGFNWVDWYLDGPPNLNSSRLLEVAAPEFHCQGLELDYTVLCWSWDLIPGQSGWRPRYLGNRKDAKWYDDKADAQFALNTYRVLLTRARQGMVIWVPEGDRRSKTHELYDPSRDAAEADSIYARLVESGCHPLPS